MAFELETGFEPVTGYRLVKKLGKGGFGEVWQAVAPGDVGIAMKFVRFDTGHAREEERALQLIRNIRHPHLLDVQFAQVVENYLIMATPLCDESLWDKYIAYQEEGRPGIPRSELLRYMSESARAIDFLNERRHDLGDGTKIGIQHRDIKPQNIFLVGGSVRVADFGLASIVDDGTTGIESTPYYAAPEALLGKPSSRSDQYSLAVTYCQLRTGRLPFEGNLQEVMYKQVEEEPDLSSLLKSEQLVISRAMQKSPDERWPSCQVFVQYLSESSYIPASALSRDKEKVTNGNDVATPYDSSSAIVDINRNESKWKNKLSTALLVVGILNFLAVAVLIGLYLTQPIPPILSGDNVGTQTQIDPNLKVPQSQQRETLTTTKPETKPRPRNSKPPSN